MSRSIVSYSEVLDLSFSPGFMQSAWLAMLFFIVEWVSHVVFCMSDSNYYLFGEIVVEGNFFLAARVKNASKRAVGSESVASSFSVDFPVVACDLFSRKDFETDGLVRPFLAKELNYL